jgi:phosphoglucosamine mutase
MESMLAGRCNLGGEQSGHLIFRDHATTGDGMIAALQVLTIMRRTGVPLSRLGAVMVPVPQLLRSFKVPRKQPIETLPELARTIREVERELGADGRILVRYSGTETKLRVMVECVDEVRIAAYIDRVERAALKALAA